MATDEEIERACNTWQRVGREAGIKAAADLIEQRAATAFLEGCEQQARVLRDLSKEVRAIPSREGTD